MNVFELETSVRDRLLADAKRTPVARGDFVYSPLDAANCVYFVDSGRIKIVRSNASGSESIVGIRNPGDIFGEISWM
ncbi:MAG: cyclic nucleotide-binding domain-containing protein, partial [Candidatus Eremiobacteraeota bacterium]|nr:cyclic nucleotide-binding domain-containing protein [Candidatus Eremiobacteraeota bacterium]